jgi:hypothetical protein
VSVSLPLLLDLHADTAMDLPGGAHRGLDAGRDADRILNALAETGASRVQLDAGRHMALIRAVSTQRGTRWTGSIALRRGEDVAGEVRRLVDLGAESVTARLGSGLEDEATVFRGVESLLEAASRSQHPVLLAIRRGTVTHDPRSTAALLRRFPEVCVSGDFAEWYLGHEMTFGRFARTLAAMSPVFSRVRALTGRIASAECLQVPLPRPITEDRSPPALLARLAARHQRALWTRSIAGFVQSVDPGTLLPFVVHLSPQRVVHGEGAPLDEDWDRLAEVPRYVRWVNECVARAVSAR